MRTYEVRGYSSQERFDNVDGTCLEYNMTRKREAMKSGKNMLKIYPIVKVQSSDREFIEILTRG